ncbi:c-type cytochrome [Antarctobacter jejuensis]|uniref:c-type cytochrome n=1 Tax=Antarctobacter jejuensis TaxID=1439938 RepID=UPI003FD0492F
MNLKSAKLALVVTALTVTAVAAEETGHGKAYYDQYCATCHGLEGAGDGPMVEMILNKVPDLTQLSANNDGVFPMLEVVNVIDGRTDVRGHGVPMPVYGGLFAAEVGNGMPEAEVVYGRGKVLSIAYYLETLQK